ncbi:MAG: glycerol-3-phosphate 1-O-acyltransferase PlsY [Deferribacteraceae bacterium]|jgi:glycerol-3-phosphate acyltransferase PlsY|nr:glycerol-3-phosphate 1-O-acyltransferase PlsY [Deferribacteraceae bacterium]
MLIAAIIVLICYLVGALPTAYILVKLLKGIDVRTIGSGNVGATNAGRALGRWAFFTVMILDALKGFIPLFLISINLPIEFSLWILNANFLLICALAVLVGHMYPIYLRFTGGKGVATGLGVFLALAPVPILIGLAVFIIVTLISRMISAGSICAAIALGIAVTAMMSSWLGLVIFTWLIAFVVIFKHRSNVQRIMNGTENKIRLGNSNS